MKLTWKKCLAGCGMAIVLAATFLAYLRPDFALDLATRVIACF